MTATATGREHRPIALPRDPAVVLTGAKVPSVRRDRRPARWPARPWSWAGCLRSRGENSDGYAWLWGDIGVSAAGLDGRDPGEVHAFLAHKVEGIGQQWWDITDDGALIVCAGAWLDSRDYFDRRPLPEAVARLNTTRPALLDALNTPTARGLSRGCPLARPARSALAGRASTGEPLSALAVLFLPSPPTGRRSPAVSTICSRRHLRPCRCHRHRPRPRPRAALRVRPS